MDLFRTKSVEAIQAGAQGEGGEHLRKSLSARHLVGFGIGIVIGTGIFTLTGVEARNGAGPSVVISFAIAGVVALLAALCYAELASSVPTAGSAYTYAYATIGELPAWIIGWDLLLEFALGCATVARGWSGYLGKLLHLPTSLFGETSTFNAGAVLIVVVLTVVAVLGVQQSARITGLLVILKVAVCVFVIVGMVRYTRISTGAPISDAFDQVGLSWASVLVSIAAVAGLTSVILVELVTIGRIGFAMGRDGLVPRALARVSPRTGAPSRVTITFAVLVVLLAGFFPISTLADLVSIGTLFAFVLVSLAVPLLRRTRPEIERSFRTPLSPVLPVVSALACLYLMLNLSIETWLRFVVWLVIGLVIYAFYGYRHSRVGVGVSAGVAETPGVRSRS